MDISRQKSIHNVVFVLGLVLIIGGIVTEIHGACIIGVIVAAVNSQL